MDDAEQPENDDASAPFTYDEFRRRRRDRPLRELPSLTRASVRLVHRAASRELRIEVVLSVAAGLCAAAQLVFTRTLLQRLLQIDGGGEARAIVWPLVGFVVVYSVGSIVSLMQSEMRRVLGELAASYAQSMVAQAASSARLVDFERPAFHDRLQRAMANAGARPVQVAYALISIVTALLTAAGVVVALAVVQPILLPLIVVAFGPMWIVSRAVSRLAFTFELEESEADRRRSYLLWLLTDKMPAKEVRAYGLDDYFDREHRRLWGERIGRLRSVTGRRMRVGALGRALNGVLFGVIVGVLAWLLSSGRTTVPEAAVAAGAILLLSARLSSAVTSFGQLYESSLFLNDVMSFLEESNARDERTAPGQTAPMLDTIEVRGAHFAYPSANHEALRGVDISVARGEVVALVGANGSGKTTLAKLIGQLYEPVGGTMLWNGFDASSFDLTARREQIAFMFQDFEKYFFTASENIGFGHTPQLGDRTAIIAAATRAGADDLVTSLPQGYDSLLGPQFIGGTDLSIGQWQRLAIARAFFRDARLVILDEPSSALDPDAEAALYARLRDLCADRAVLIISHRFSTVKGADRIYVLDQGNVIEHGSHSDLINIGGTYARMFHQQAAQFLDLDRDA